jgi:phenylalanyl-tRNA synthetase beta subunit
VVSVNEINKRIGIDITVDEAARLLTRMQLPSHVSKFSSLYFSLNCDLRSQKIRRA